ncbi:MAG: Fic family protein [Roseburia sp.]|nr:Fic family protein [Roseburia sp.]
MFEPKFVYTTDMINDLLKIERYRTALEYLYLPTRIKQELIYKAKMKKTHFSTSIEGNLLSYDQVERVINKKGNDTKINAEKEVLNYWDALTFLEKSQEEKRPVSTDFIRELHGHIAKKKSRHRKSVFRGEMPPGVLFAVYDNRTGMPEYIPPEWSDIESLISDLVNWYQEETKLPIPIQAAIMHYQLATIHPFEDGNGRTSRALATYVLMQNGYDFKGFHSMEEYYALDLDGYYENLQMGLPTLYYDGRNDPPHLEQWISFFLRIMALNAEKIYEVAEKATEKGKTNHLLNSLTKKDMKMLRYVLENHLEYIKTKDLADVFLVTPRAISKWCQTWCEKGLLVANYKNVRIISYSLAPEYKSIELSSL